MVAIDLIVILECRKIFANTHFNNPFSDFKSRIQARLGIGPNSLFPQFPPILK